MTDNEALNKIANELERLNDLLEMEMLLKHREWTNEKYIDKQKAVADILCERINQKLVDKAYTYKNN